jgi:hypothetical protein
MIFNILAQNSERLAYKLVQIIFDTKNFVETMPNGENNSGSDTGVDIATKLKNLILTNSLNLNNGAPSGRKKGQSPEAQKYNVIIHFYANLCDLNVLGANEQGEESSMYAKFFKNSTVVFTMLKFLFNLFKVSFF